MSDHNTVLLVEDDPNDVLLIQRSFRRAHVANPLYTVGDGEEAIAFLEGTGKYADRDQFPFPCLMLLDLKLPKKSGLEVLAWLRSQPGIKRLPVVVLTSSREAPDVNRAYDLGVNSYLVKPVDPHELFRLAESLNVYWLMFNQRPMI